MKMKPVHPGEILVEEFLVPMGISQYRLAKEIHVPLRRVNEIALGRRGISADTALRFARFFGGLRPRSGRISRASTRWTLQETASGRT